MELLYFILGIIFVSYIIPIVDRISAWFLTWVEAKKSKQSEIVNKANIKMRQDAASAAEDVSLVRQIGFQVPSDDQEEEEDNEDEV